jgi:hypothetical protein
VHETQTAQEEVVASRNLTLEFKDYEKDGIILPEGGYTYTSNGDALAEIKFPEVTAVKIRGKSLQWHSLDGTDDQCSKSNFLTVQRGETTSILFGHDVYEINDSQKFPFEDDAGNKYEILLARNFDTGADDENGLTGCTEISYLVVRRLADGRLSLIESPLVDSNSAYFAFTNSSGAGESINQVSFQNDSVAVDVRVSYQEGSASYRLLIAMDGKLSKAMITKRKKRE